jgi:hypothetical protein
MRDMASRIMMRTTVAVVAADLALKWWWRR